MHASGRNGISMKKGLFITFEGIDGAGKSTQINLLKEYFENKGVTVYTTREPGGTDIGNKIRQILLDKENTAMCGMAELLLYYADRAQHIKEFINPALESGACVICDRYYDSSYAYQLAGRGINTQILDMLNSIVVKEYIPDVTFLLDIPLEQSDKRMSKRGGEYDRMEIENNTFKQNVRLGFLEQANNNPDRICVVNALQTPEKIFEDILNRIKTMKVG